MSPSAGESQQHIGPYRLLGRIGAGGMGVVYRVQHQGSRQVAAIKVFRPARFTRQLLQRFHTEVEALSRLRHPGICRIYEVGTATTSGGPAPYLVMELVEGRSLAAHAHENKLGAKQRVELLLKLCDAVEHAHEKGIIHRDLKPANIIVTGDGQPKVLDFGIARAIDAEPMYELPAGVAAATLVGTLAYMSPEQAGREVERLDARSDVYSLGVIGYELIAGRLPYGLHDKTVQQILHAIRTQPPRPIGEVVPECAGDLEGVLDKALQKQRQDRYESARALGEDLQRYAQGQPTHARRPKILSALDRVAKQTRGAVGAVGERVRGAMHRDEDVAAPAPTSVPPVAPGSHAGAPSHPASLRPTTWPERVREGVHQMRDGDCAMALLWFVAALAKCVGEPTAEAILRTRVALMLQQSPRLIDVDPPGPPAPAWLAAPDRTLELANDTRANTFLVRVVEADTSRTLLGPLWHHTTVNQAEFVDDGSAVMTTCRDDAVRLWSAAAQHSLAQYAHHRDAVTCVAFSPAGDVVVTGDVAGLAFVVRRGTGVAPLAPAHAGAVRCAAFTHDGRLLATGGDDGHVRVWEAATGRAMQAAPIAAEQPVVEVHFVRDGKQVMAAMTGGAARVWDVASGKPMTPALEGGTQVHRALMREARSHAPVELAPQRTGVEVPPALAKLLTTASATTPGGITHASLTRDARFALTVSGRGEALLWEVAGPLPLSAPLDPEARATAGALSADAALCAVGSGDGTVRLFSLAPDPRPLDDLKMLAEALSCHLVDDTLGLYPLSAPDWRAAWLRAAPALRREGRG